MHLIHGQQGHLDTQVNRKGVWREAAGRLLFLVAWAGLPQSSDRNWLLTWRFLSMIQLASKSSSSSPNGLMSCSATWGSSRGQGSTPGTVGRAAGSGGLNCTFSQPE